MHQAGGKVDTGAWLLFRTLNFHSFPNNNGKFTPILKQKKDFRRKKSRERLKIL